jgi:hypothetical protein
MALTLATSKDRKVTNAVNVSGDNALFSNTFGLANGKAYSCPGATDYCETICYAGKLEKMYTGVRNSMLNNFRTLEKASLSETIYMLDGIVTKFISESRKRNAEMVYRIHWDGDFFSADYIEAWRTVIAEYSMVKFWVYTRNVAAATSLHKANLSNLSLYFSADPVNESVAAMFFRTYGIRPAAVANTFAESQAMVKRITGRVGAKCPEQTGQLPLISTKGSACTICRLCIDNKANISFAKSKK